MSTGMVGADVDSLRQFASRVGQSASTLDSLSQAVRWQLYSAGWDGGDAEAFRRDWDSQHAPAIQAVASHLRTSSQRLLAEAQQQENTSNSYGGSLAGTGRGIGSLAIDVLGPLRQGFLGVLGLAGLANVLTRNATTVGRYTDNWRRVIDAFGDGARYKTSPVLQSLAKVPWLKQFGAFGEIARPIGQVVDRIDIAESTWRATESARSGNWGDSAYQSAEAIARGLKMSKNPVSYFIGVNVDVWKDVVATASVVRWDAETWQSTNPFVGDNFERLWLPSFGDATVETVKKLPAWLT